MAEADMLIVGGTSLVVYPAAGLIDLYHGRKLVLINRDETPADAGRISSFTEVSGRYCPGSRSADEEGVTDGYSGKGYCDAEKAASLWEP